MRKHGLDISHHQLFFNANAKDWDFVYLKLSEGQLNYVKDHYHKEYTQQMAKAMQDVPIRGGYHYMRSGYHWQKQAETYLEATSGLNLHFHVCDVEKINNKFTGGFANEIVEWMHLIKVFTRQPTLLYGNAYHLMELFYPRHAKWLKKQPLILAQYKFNYWDEELRNVVTDENVLPYYLLDELPPVLIWQYSDKYPGKDEGITNSNGMDVNVWLGATDINDFMCVPKKPIVRIWRRLTRHIRRSIM